MSRNCLLLFTCRQLYEAEEVVHLSLVLYVSSEGRWRRLGLNSRSFHQRWRKGHSSSNFASLVPKLRAVKDVDKQQSDEQSP